MPRQRRTFKLEPTDLRAAPARRYAAGRARREAVPLEAHAEVAAGARRADPLAILVKQEKTRLSEFIPLRYGRMSRTPFTFLRGSAAIMASDLAAGARTDLEVELCGDAHLGNFRWYHAPTRELVFDLNDFDETLPGPFEWDVKRLAASITVAGRASGFTNEQARRATRSAMRDYRKSIAETAARNPLDLHYYRFESRGALERIGTHGKSHRKWKEAVLAKATRRNSMLALEKLTKVVKGRRRIAPDPPLIVRVDAKIASGRGACRHGVPGRTTVRASPWTTACCSTGSRWSMWPARSSASAASGPVVSSRCSRPVTARHFSCNSSRPRHPFSNPTSEPARSSTRANASSKASA